MDARVGAAPTSLQTDGRWDAKVALKRENAPGNHLKLAMLRCGSVFASASDTAPASGHPSEMFAHEGARASESLPAWLQTGIPQMPGVDHMGPDLQAHGHVSLTCRGGKPYRVIK